MTIHRVVCVAASVLSIACIAGPAAAADYRYTVIDKPGATATQVFRMNARGDTVGKFSDESGGPWGFLLVGGHFAEIRVPDSVTTQANGINDRGDIVGLFRNADMKFHGFLLSGDSFVTIDVPTALGTRAWDINAAGQVSGEYQDPVTRRWRGFSWRNGQFAYFDVPGSTLTTGYGINDRGEIAGHFTVPGRKMQGYIFSEGAFTLVDNPESGNFMSCAQGIGVHGEAVGHYVKADIFYTDTQSYAIYGQVYRGGEFEPIEAPGARETYAMSITPSGAIAGYFWAYDSATETWTLHGFVATPLNPVGR